jgi:hypothetical protein
LQHVLHIPAGGNNRLISIIQLARKGAEVHLDSKGAIIQRGVSLVAKAPIIGDFYVLRHRREDSLAPASASVAISPAVDQDDILLWHRRLGHFSLLAIKRIVSQGTAAGIDIHKKSPNSCVCGACVMGKLSRNPFKSVNHRSTKPLELIHSDVMGPTQTTSFGGKRYAIFFRDDATRYTRVYFMKAKSEAPDYFRDYRAEVEKQLDQSIKRIRVDGGGEYSSREFLTYHAENGIIKVTTAPYSSQQNGVSERCNRTVVDPARSMLKAAAMPNVFWAEAVNTAGFKKNMIPTRALPKGTTPFEKCFGRKPDLDNLRTFGCLAYAWNPDTTARKKFDDRATKTVLIGYGATGSHYKLFDVARKRVLVHGIYGLMKPRDMLIFWATRRIKVAVQVALPIILGMKIQAMTRSIYHQIDLNSRLLLSNYQLRHHLPVQASLRLQLHREVQTLSLRH